MKLIELVVLDEENKDLGIDAIALVDEPAIEEGFYFFNRHSFVTPQSGEQQDEFISRCIPVLIGEGKDQDQAAAICYSYWKEKMNMFPTDEITPAMENFGADTSALPAYTDQTGQTKKKKVKTFVEIIQEALAAEDVSEDDLVAGTTYIALAEEGQVPNNGEVYFTYKGEGPERTFCDTYWNREFNLTEIFNLNFNNPGFGPEGSDYYNTFLYKGGPNCKHYWEPTSITLDFRGLDPMNVKFNPVKHRPFLILDLQRHGYSEADLETAKTPMYDMANRGYLMNSVKNYAFADEDQRIVVGPIMIPDLKILRRDEETGKFYQVYFSKNTVKRLSEKYMRELKIHNANEHHDPNMPTNVTMLESWIIEDSSKDKSALYGFQLPVGTWFGAFRINNDETWKKVKDGTFKGFSIEGNFQERLIKES